MKLHPLTAPYQALQRGVSVGSTLFFLGLISTSVLGVGGPLAGVGLGVVGFLLGAAYAVAYYRRFEYELTDDTFDIVSGVVGRRRREIPLRRIQNVDISQDVVSRALGIATVGIETAGGGETEAHLRFVGVAEADRLQRELRRRKAGRREGREGSAAAGETDADAADADGERATDAATDRVAVEGTDTRPETEPYHDEVEETLFELAPRELVLLSFASVNVSGLVLSVIFFPVVNVVQPTQVAEMASEGTASPLFVAVSVLRFLAFLALAWVFSAALNFAQYYDFRLSRVGDELQYERGLLQRYSGSIPLDKVQALAVRENPLKRRLGYATVAIETAGYAGGNGQGSGSSAAVPLATRERALALARTVEPFGDATLERPPRRARRRYAARYALVLLGLTGVLYAVDAVTGGLAVWYLPLAGLVAVPVAAHLKWRNRGYDLGDEHVRTRTGFWRRTTKIVPYYRIQTVVQSATVFQRRRRLASVTADTAGSASLQRADATAYDVDADTATTLRETLRERLRERVHDRKEDRRRRRLERLAAATGEGGVVAAESRDGTAAVGSPATAGAAEGDDGGEDDGTDDDGTDDGPDDDARASDEVRDASRTGEDEHGSPGEAPTSPDEAPDGPETDREE